MAARKTRTLDFQRRVRKELVRIKGTLVEFYRDGRKWHWRAAKSAVRILTRGDKKA